MSEAFLSALTGLGIVVIAQLAIIMMRLDRLNDNVIALIILMRRFQKEQER